MEVSGGTGGFEGLAANSSTTAVRFGRLNGDTRSDVASPSVSGTEAAGASAASGELRREVERCRGGGEHRPSVLAAEGSGAETAAAGSSIEEEEEEDEEVPSAEVAVRCAVHEQEKI